MRGVAPAGPADVLLVEDNPGDVRLTKEAFAEAEVDTTFHVVTDGTECLEFLSERTGDESLPLPDLILLDLNLPRTDGLEVLETIRDEPELSRIPVLVLTSSRARDDVRESYEKCANAFLVKPTDPGEFSSLVSAVGDFWFDNVQLPPTPA